MLKNTRSPKTVASSAGPAGIPLSEFAQRRARVQKELGGAVGLIFSGDAGGHHYEPDPMFVYLTGITDEPGAAVLFDASNEDAERRIVLLLRPLNPELERWDGYRDTISTDLKKRYGFEHVMRTTALPELLAGAARRCKRLACLHPFGSYVAPLSADLGTFRKVAERMVGVGIEDKTSVLPMMRAVKSPAEVALIRKAIDITAGGYKAAMGAIRLAMGEKAIQTALEETYRALGASGTAYDSIVGSGLRGTVLHYRANDQPTEPGDLLVIDSGAKYGGYCADITRTYPVGGRFTSEQRDLYELVLQAQLASIKAVKPGATITDVNNATRAVFSKRGVQDYYIHGIGHHLGLQVHDANPSTPLSPGMVLTIEPGLYIAEKKMGVRIEDDVLVTRGGCEVMSAMIPKSVKDVESALRG